MLIEFFGRNFASFRDEFRLSMLATDIDPGDERGAVEVSIEGDDEPLRLLRCAAIYGPNASGKSNLLRAAHALRYLLERSGQLASDQPLGPYEPFLLDEKNARRPVTLGLRAVIEGRVYQYRIDFTRKRFVHEELVEIGPNEDRQLFVREGQNVSGHWTSHEQFKLLTQSFRPNALLLSLADRLAPELAGQLGVGFPQLLQHHDPTHTLSFAPLGAQPAASRAAKNKRFGKWMLGLLQAADFGIVDYDAQRIRDERRDDDPRRDDIESLIKYRLDLSHAASRGAVELSYFRESMGTRRMVELAPLIDDLLHGKAIVAYFVDEIGASLHPHLLEGTIRRFNCEANPKSIRGQMVFATHETKPLDAEARDATLRRDQIYLTDKDASGASRLYSVAEFKERNNLNLRRRYLQGRYGALPALTGLGD